MIAFQLRSISQHEVIKSYIIPFSLEKLFLVEFDSTEIKLIGKCLVKKLHYVANGAKAVLVMRLSACKFTIIILPFSVTSQVLLIIFTLFMTLYSTTDRSIGMFDMRISSLSMLMQNVVSLTKALIH